MQMAETTGVLNARTPITPNPPSNRRRGDNREGPCGDIQLVLAPRSAGVTWQQPHYITPDGEWGRQRRQKRKALRGVATLSETPLKKHGALSAPRRIPVPSRPGAGGFDRSAKGAHSNKSSGTKTTKKKKHRTHTNDTEHKNAIVIFYGCTVVQMGARGSVSLG